MVGSAVLAGAKDNTGTERHVIIMMLIQDKNITRIAGIKYSIPVTRFNGRMEGQIQPYCTVE